MEFLKVLQERRSVRRFKPEAVPEESLQRILEAARIAPSAGNLQAFQVFVARSEEKRKELADASFGQSFVAKAPIVLVFCADLKASSRVYAERGERLYALQDASIAATFAMLAAVDEGLASCWVGAFEDERVKKALETELQPVAIFPIGFADEKPRKARRKELKELLKEA